MQIKKIYFDLDGVLADFDKGCLELCNITPRKQGCEIDPAEDEEHWSRIRKIDHFYNKLDVFPGSKEMFDSLYERYGAACEILSAIPKPSRGIESSYEDKTNWVRRLISKDVVINLVYRDNKKTFCTGKDCVLIDDYAKNINEWNAIGGTGILFQDPKETITRITILSDQHCQEVRTWIGN